jgi:cell division protein ZapA
MERRTVQLRVAGQTYRVVTTATDAELKRMVGVIDEKLAEVTPRGKAPAPNALLLVALALVHEADEAKERATRVEARARQALSGLLERIDAALGEEGEEASGEAEAEADPHPAPPC